MPVESGKEMRERRKRFVESHGFLGIDRHAYEKKGENITYAFSLSLYGNGKIKSSIERNERKRKRKSDYIQ